MTENNDGGEADDDENDEDDADIGQESLTRVLGAIQILYN